MDLISTLIERLEIRLNYAERFAAESLRENNLEREACWSARAEALCGALTEARDIQALAASKEQGPATPQETEPSKKHRRRIEVRVHPIHERTSNTQRTMFVRLP